MMGVARGCVFASTWTELENPGAHKLPRRNEQSRIFALKAVAPSLVASGGSYDWRLSHYLFPLAVFFSFFITPVSFPSPRFLFLNFLFLDIKYDHILFWTVFSLLESMLSLRLVLTNMAEGML